MFDQNKLTNLKLCNLGCEDIQSDKITFSVSVLRVDDQLDLAAWVEAGHGEVRTDGGHVGQDEAGEAVHHLQDKHLVQTSIKAWLALHLYQLCRLRGQMLKY